MVTVKHWKESYLILKPRRMRPRPRDLPLQLHILNHGFLHRVHQQHPSGLQAALQNDFRWVHIVHANLNNPLKNHAWLDHDWIPHLAGHHHRVVLRDVEPGRPQAVPVEDGADEAAVGEGDEGGAVPGFHGTSGPVVVVSLFFGHRWVVLPGLRNHRHHGL